MTVRQLLKIIILGMSVWGLSLVWSEINEVLTPGVTLGLIAGLGTAGLALILSQHSNHRPGQRYAWLPDEITPLAQPWRSGLDKTLSIGYN